VLQFYFEKEVILKVKIEIKRRYRDTKKKMKKKERKYV